MVTTDFFAFVGWLRAQAKRTDAVGRFAAWWSGPKGHTGLRTLSQMDRHIRFMARESSDNGDGLIEARDLAWREYAARPA